MPASPALSDIPGVWVGERQFLTTRTLPSCIGALDAALRGGWPAGSLVQIASAEPGLGFSLIVPLLAAFTAEERHVALVGTPFTPYAPALSSRGVDLRFLTWLAPVREEDALWSLEQTTRSGLFAAVAYWGPAIDGTSERRVQLAADAGDTIAFHFVVGARDAHSYAAVRLAVFPAGEDLEVDVQKCRGGRSGHRLRCTSPIAG